MRTKTENKDPICKSIIGTITNLQNKPPKRTYIVGGRNGKVKGFNFFIYEEKLKPYQRRKLFKESEDLIDSLINEELKMVYSLDKVDKTLSHLDPSLTDLEIMGSWNEIYDKYGCRMIPFKDKIERGMILQFNKEQKKEGGKNEVVNGVSKNKLTEFLRKRKKPIVEFGF